MKYSIIGIGEYQIYLNLCIPSRYIFLCCFLSGREGFINYPCLECINRAIYISQQD